MKTFTEFKLVDKGEDKDSVGPFDSIREVVEYAATEPGWDRETVKLMERRYTQSVYPDGSRASKRNSEEAWRSIPLQWRIEKVRKEMSK